MPVTEVSNPDYEFADVVASRKVALDEMARTRARLRPLTATLRGVFGASRALGLEYALFRRFARPMVRMFDTAIDQAFGDYAPQGSDVVVCSYFKSGTNWAMHTAYQVAERGAGDFEDMLDVAPWVDCPEQRTTVQLRDPRPLARSRTGHRVIKTHARAQFVPYNAQAKYIAVVRDPKEVVVSGYHFFGSMLFGSLMPSVETWVRHCTSEEAFFHPWPEFTAGYWAWRERPNVLFLTYNEMLDDPVGVIRRIAGLMQVDLGEDEIARVRELTGFEHMKRIDHKFYPGEVSPFARPGGQMIRSGKGGNSGELLSLDQQRRIDDWCREGLRRLGSDFPYDRMFGA